MQLSQSKEQIAILKVEYIEENRKLNEIEFKCLKNKEIERELAAKDAKSIATARQIAHQREQLEKSYIYKLRRDEQKKYKQIKVMKCLFFFSVK